MFIDWLSIYQDFDELMPIISETFDIQVDVMTGEQQVIKQPTYKETGSYCSSIRIKVSGNRVKVEGNPSRFCRVDNLFGFETIEECVSVYNLILLKNGLPPFTKCTQVFREQSPEDKRVLTSSDGAIITELHITENKAVGKDCPDQYIKAISTQRFKNSIPRLHTNGKSCDWLTPKGNGGMNYPTVYNKANEIKLHSQTKLKNKYGENSREYEYLKEVIRYCENNGVVRFEQKLKSSFLRRKNLRYYGLINQKSLEEIHKQFIEIDKKLQVNAMNIEMINERLQRLGICKTAKAANTTSFYAMEWMNGKRFDLRKTQVQLHRSRLRKIGIDIAEVCDLTKFAPVYVISSKEIIVKDLQIPDWYQKASSNHLRLVA